jgi:hypothetical protein
MQQEVRNLFPTVANTGEPDGYIQSPGGMLF